MRFVTLSMPALARITCVVAFLSGGTPLVWAQPAVSTQAVQAALAGLDQVTGLSEADLASARTLYEAALGDLVAAERWENIAESYRRAAEAAPGEMRRAAAALAQPVAFPGPTLPPNPPLDQLEQTLATRTAELDKARLDLAQAQSEPARRGQRRTELLTLLLAARERQRALRDQDRQAVAQTEPAALTEARQIVTLARERRAASEIDAYEQELRAYDAEADLLPLRRDLAARLVPELERTVADLQERLSRRRQTEVARQTQEAEQLAAATLDPGLRPLAEVNAAIAAERVAVGQAVEQASTEAATAAARVVELEADFEQTRTRVAAVGTTPSMGLFLRRRLAELPEPGALYRRVVARRQLIQEVQGALFDLDDRRLALRDLDVAVAREVGAALPEAEAAEASTLSAEAAALLTTRAQYLDALINDQRRHLELLVNLSASETQLSTITSAFRAFIEERVLWTRSANRLGVADLRGLPEAVQGLASPQGIRDLASYAWADVRGNPALIAVLLIALWLVRQIGRLFEAQLPVPRRAAPRTSIEFAPTLVALIAALVRTTPLVVLLFVAWRLSSPLVESSFVQAQSVGLFTVAFLWIPLSLVRRICAVGGLAERHFGWAQEGLEHARRQLRWLVPALLPLVYLTAVAYGMEDTRLLGSVGRVTFIAGLLLTALFVLRTLTPGGGVFRGYLQKRRGGWVERLRYVWTPGLVLAPLGLAGMVLAGYIHAAVDLAVHLQATVWFLIAVLLGHALTLRWLAVIRRRISLRRGARPSNEGIPDDEGAPRRSLSHADLTTIHMGIEKLVKSIAILLAVIGVWVIWVDVVPALGVLDRVALWQTEGVDPAVPNVITLMDLLLAGLILLMTAIVARNLPALQEIFLVQWGLRPGSRYATATLSRYVVVGTGLLILLSRLGVTWDKAQWLVAALGLGLGFGLQEIFANFVSGIMLLFERPVRVGDTISVDGTTGTVTQIRLRATTLKAWDMQELVIPNKDLVTGRLLNWTLTDAANRVTLSVGVGYGSDPALVTQLLRSIVTEHPKIAKEPKALITFQEFGDSALIFTLRLYLSALEDRLPVIHEVNTKILLTFREHGIEIAFPQRDLHLRSIGTDTDLAAFAEAAGTGRSPAPDALVGSGISGRGAPSEGAGTRAVGPPGGRSRP